MSRKKHQSDPGEDSFDSQEEEIRYGCRHVQRSVDLTKMRKLLGLSTFLSQCSECEKKTLTETKSDAGSNGHLSICLKCGHIACGKLKNNHFAKHSLESHALSVDINSWVVWCNECETEVSVNRKKLIECVKYLKKFVNVASGIHKVLPTLPRPRGLGNLGNTCFFNSVMQCLGQTPYLLEMLQKISQPEQHFKLAGGDLKLANGEIVQLEPLEGTTEKWRLLPQIFAETLAELQSGRPEVYYPRLLFNKLTTRMTQFAGGDQHDAHELLRTLLEAVREEDLRRYQSVILEKLGLNKKTLPSTVADDKKKIVKFYGQQVSDMLLATKQVFRGMMTSILKCNSCGHVSNREEYFLDLSLPISHDINGKNHTSTHVKTQNNRVVSPPSSPTINNVPVEKDVKEKSTDGSNDDSAVNSDCEMDADVEDNLEELVPKTVKPKKPSELPLKDKLVQKGKNRFETSIQNGIDDNDHSAHRLQQRYECKPDEYSVMSCLNQFTDREMLRNHDAVRCEECPKRLTDPPKVHSSSKQLLISDPPAILILHLKRFQIKYNRCVKISKFVVFPPVLDLAPACSAEAKDLPTINPDDPKVLYSLYGVIEHSGSINGGHYVAYVKIRPPLEEKSYRWRFIPKNQKDSTIPIPDEIIEEPLPGKWYYISDSRVSEVSESKVFQTEAYLLFYERIL